MFFFLSLSILYEQKKYTGDNHTAGGAIYKHYILMFTCSSVQTTPPSTVIEHSNTRSALRSPLMV